MINEINHIWTAEMKWKWRNDHRSERNLCNCVKKPEKNSGLRDTDAMLYQLSYEATDVGSRSIVGLYVAMKEMIYEINHIWTAEMKWKWRNDRRSERNLRNCVKKPEKNSALILSVIVCHMGLYAWKRHGNSGGSIFPDNDNNKDHYPVLSTIINTPTTTLSSLAL